MSRVTVLLTNYNAAEYVGRAITSVCEQTYTDWELLLMDDGSDEETRKVLEEHMWLTRSGASRIGIAQFDPTPDERAATVRYATLLNWGAAQTSGEYLTFLCGDDYYLPDRLERMVDTLDRWSYSIPGVVAYGAQHMIQEDGTEVGVRPANDEITDAYHRVDLNSVMMTRAAFNVAGGFPDTPASPELWREADAHMWRRLTDAGYVFVPVLGGPTDVKLYRFDGVDARVIRGETPWALQS